MARILIAEDDLAIQRLIKRTLAADGHEFIEANDGDSAYTMAVSRQPDIILLDLNLPGMNGFLVLEKLKANPSTQDIPVIILTGNLQPQDEARGIQSGALDYITKPWGSKELNDRIRMALAYLEAHQKRPPLSQPPRRPDEIGKGGLSRQIGIPIESGDRVGPQAGPDSCEPETGLDGHGPGMVQDAVRAFLQKQNRYVEQIKFTRITEIQVSGMDGYGVEGITTVAVPFALLVTRDGRIIDCQGRPLDETTD